MIIPIVGAAAIVALTGRIEFALIAGLWLTAALGDAWRARWRDAALAVALAALLIVGYRAYPGGGKVADDAYVKFVRPTVAVAPR